MKAAFMNTLKEAVFIKDGDCTKVNNLSVADTTDLWEGLKKHDHDRFHGVALKLQEHLQGQFARNIPLRLFVVSAGVETATCIQDSVAAFDSSTGLVTLRKGLQQLMPSGIELDTSRVMVQGIRPSLDTPLVWMSENACNADQFLYIIVHL